MKRHGNLWDKILDLENIKFAHRQARRGKAFYTEVKMIDADVEKYCKDIQQMLSNKTFTTSPYEIEDRFDGRKMRTIYKLPYYPDRIVQHALLNIVGPLLTNTFIRDSFQSIEGRGTSDGCRRIKKLVRSKECSKYALKIDIEKYYPSVNNNIMKQAVRRKIKCKDTLWLIDNIIDSMAGLPIGNYTSQHFGNLYLNQFDWWIKQEVKPKGYFRYCDDIVVFADTTKELIDIKNKMIDRLTLLNLKVKPNWNIYNVYKNGIDFVGFNFKPNVTKLRKSIAVKFKKNCKRINYANKTVDPLLNLNSLMAYKGWAQMANGKQLWRTHTNKLIQYYPKQLRVAL
jgi:RNA-directed DNA polymerase